MQQTVFDILKQKLTEKPILVYSDFNKMFKLYTNTSDIRLGAVLMQKDNQEKDYEAKTLISAEKNYLTTEKKCLAIMWTM